MLIPPRIYVRKKPLNTPEEFWGSCGHRLDVMPVEMHLQLPKNDWKDTYGALLRHINIFKEKKFFWQNKFLSGCKSEIIP